MDYDVLLSICCKCKFQGCDIVVRCFQELFSLFTNFSLLWTLVWVAVLVSYSISNDLIGLKFGGTEGVIVEAALSIHCRVLFGWKVAPCDHRFFLGFFTIFQNELNWLVHQQAKKSYDHISVRNQFFFSVFRGTSPPEFPKQRKRTQEKRPRPIRRLRKNILMNAPVAPFYSSTLSILW
jgi:hypothetical protein